MTSMGDNVASDQSGHDGLDNLVSLANLQAGAVAQQPLQSAWPIASQPFAIIIRIDDDLAGFIDADCDQFFSRSLSLIAAMMRLFIPAMNLEPETVLHLGLRGPCPIDEHIPVLGVAFDNEAVGRAAD